VPQSRRFRGAEPDVFRERTQGSRHVQHLLLPDFEPSPALREARRVVGAHALVNQLEAFP